MAKKKKVDTLKKSEIDTLKKDIGKRFKEFRKAIDKAQHQLAHEVGVFQSTITNFELGKTFPNIGYLYHFYTKYGLNIHWLITGGSHKFVLDHTKRPDVSYVMESSVKYGDPRYEDYIDLLKCMQVPEIERIILGKLTELKATFKDKVTEINSKAGLDTKKMNEGV